MANEPVIFDNEGLKTFIKENIIEVKGDSIGDFIASDEEIEQFKNHLQATIGDWLMDNWKDFIDNRGD